jgi:hypothetical protein
VTRLLRVTGLVLVFAGAGACSISRPASGSPHIIQIIPSSGLAGADYPIQATIRGSGFTPAGNVVTFGPVRLRELPSRDGGTAITFGVPKQMSSGGEVPPMVLPPGDYQVTVTNADGISNAVTFSLTRTP